jgi:hypothetical protein
MSHPCRRPIRRAGGLVCWHRPGMNGSGERPPDSSCPQRAPNDHPRVAAIAPLSGRRSRKRHFENGWAFVAIPPLLKKASCPCRHTDSTAICHRRNAITNGSYHAFNWIQFTSLGDSVPGGRIKSPSTVGGEKSRGQLGVASYPQLFVQASHVGMDRVRRDLKPIGNLLFSIGQEEPAANLDLPWREPQFLGNALPRLLTELSTDHRAGGLLGKRRSGRPTLPRQPRRWFGWNGHNAYSHRSTDYS